MAFLPRSASDDKSNLRPKKYQRFSTTHRIRSFRYPPRRFTPEGGSLDLTSLADLVRQMRFRSSGLNGSSTETAELQTNRISDVFSGSETVFWFSPFHRATRVYLPTTVIRVQTRTPDEQQPAWGYLVRPRHYRDYTLSFGCTRRVNGFGKLSSAAVGSHGDFNFSRLPTVGLKIKFCHFGSTGVFTRAKACARVRVG